MHLKQLAVIPCLAALTQAFTFTVSSVLVGGLEVSESSCGQVTVGIDETNGKQGIGFDPSTIVPAGKDSTLSNRMQLFSQEYSW